MKRLKLIYFLSLFILSKGNAQLVVQAGGMSFWGNVEGDSILIKINAPTKGWLAVGFNDRNEIVGSDLKMFRVRNGQSEAEDQIVKGVQKHPKDSQLGGGNNINLCSGIEDAEGTYFSFKIPVNAKDKFDFSHESGRYFWLILAYSVEDVFDHHSIMRKHFKVKWSE